jgi:dipeptidyl aminopeptidase/acylaminoacyl peptidase
VLDYRKITYRSSVGDLDIPAYVFQPLEKRGPRGHAAMVWVHGGVHGNWDGQLLAVRPRSRRARLRRHRAGVPRQHGYGEAFHNAIDYGGYEVDDVMRVRGYLEDLPHVDPERVGMMGWSHGGYITILLGLPRQRRRSRRAPRSCR